MPSDPEWRPRVAELVRHGHKIQAIKLYREASGTDLATAKAFVEELERTLKSAELASATSSGNDDAALRELLRGGQKIEAIKRYRERTGAGLKEAKDAVEALAAEAGLPASRGGCAGVVVLVLCAGVCAALLSH